MISKFNVNFKVDYVSKSTHFFLYLCALLRKIPYFLHFYIYLPVSDDKSDDEEEPDQTPTRKRKKNKVAASPLTSVIEYLDRKRVDDNKQRAIDNAHRDRQFALDEDKFKAGDKERTKMLGVLSKLADRLG